MNIFYWSSLAMAILKLTHVISWSWWIIVTPMAFSFLLGMLVLVSTVIIASYSKGK